MALQTLNYRGKVIRYKTLGSLSRKLKISVQEARDLVLNPNRTVYLIQGKNIGKVKLSENPTLLRTFGVRRIENKKYVNKAPYNVKNVKILNKIPLDADLELSIDATFSFELSERETRTKNFVIQTSSRHLDRDLMNAILNYLHEFSELTENDVDVENVVVRTYQTGQQLTRVGMRLKKEEYLKIDNLFNEQLEKGKWKDCVRDYLLEKYPNMSKKKINNLGNEDGVSEDEILEWCNSNNIRCKLLDITGKLIVANTKTNVLKKALVGVCWDGHFYPLKNSYLNKKSKYVEVKVIKDCKRELVGYLRKNVLGADIVISDANIIAFTHNNIRYIQNEEYLTCIDILKKFSINDKILNPELLKIKHLGTYLEKLYIDKDSLTFWPKSGIIKGGFSFQAEHEEDDDVVGIDKNKCYADALTCLPSLLSFDYRECEINLKPKKIIPTNLYIAKPTLSSLLMPNTNCYAGDHLIYCIDQGIEFKLLEEIQCVSSFNKYKNLIKDLFEKVDEVHAKQIANIMIGKFEREASSHDNLVFDKIITNSEKDRVVGHKVMLTDKYFINMINKSRVGSVWNRKPVSIQVKDMSRRIIYQQMKDLQLTDKDIIQVHTDSIVIKNKKVVIENTDFVHGWKTFTYKKGLISDNIVDNFCTFKLSEEDNDNVLYNDYAGPGKTWHCINKLIPDLVKKGKSYVVLTPSHSTLKDYVKKGLNCKVVQTYTYSNTIPEEQYLLCDEIGMFDKNAQDLIYKASLLGKIIISFGDFNQLTPIGSKRLDNKYYNKFFYDTHKSLGVNMRNNFTFEYYDSLINGKDIKKEVMKYSSKNYYDADVIICWYNKSIEHYNELMLKKLGFKDIFNVGVKLLCKSNKLAELGCYNNFDYVIKKVNKTNVELDDGTVLSKSDISKYFRAGYAKSVYCVQGSTLNSYYYSNLYRDQCLLVDKGEDGFIEGFGYTVVSRLKQK